MLYKFTFPLSVKIICTIKIHILQLYYMYYLVLKKVTKWPWNINTVFLGSFKARYSVHMISK